MDFIFNRHFAKWAYGVFVRMHLVAHCVHSYVNYSKSKLSIHKCISYVCIPIHIKISGWQISYLEVSIEVILFI